MSELEEDPFENSEYYPLRWKLADNLEDALHNRTAVAWALALIGIVALMASFLLFGSGSSTTETSAAGDDPLAFQESIGSEEANTTTDTSQATSTTIATTTTTIATTTTTTTTIAPATTTIAPATTATPATTVSPRASTDSAVIESTESGRLMRVSPTSVELIGGLPNDAAADEAIEAAQAIFPSFDVADRQIVNEVFSDDGSTRVRLDAPDLFEYNSDAINPTYLPAIDALAAQIIVQGWAVEVGGHTDGVGPDAGNQRLSEGRAQSAAERLIGQGVDPAQVTVIGFGESQPIASNATEAGRLLNRRVEFVVGP